jgi:hypothetical protein
MKAARILIGVGLIFCALNLTAFFDLERRARAMEAQEETLIEALDNATGELLQKGPPPRGERVIGIFRTDYGTDGTFDEVSSIGTWDGRAFTHTYTEDGQPFTYCVTYAPPDEWFPYPAK